MNLLVNKAASFLIMFWPGLAVLTLYLSIIHHSTNVFNEKRGEIDALDRGKVMSDYGYVKK